jgi:hypothetical protein
MRSRISMVSSGEGSSAMARQWRSGQVRAMCGLRTGGWSLPGVMSD